MIDESGLQRSLSSFVHVLSRHARPVEVLQALVDEATLVLEARGAGVVLPRGAGLHLMAATDPTIASLENVQRTDGRGPTLDALGSGNRVAVPDLRAQVERWPAFARAATATGLLAVAAVPLGNAEVIGVCGIYAAGPKEWTTEELDVAGLYADLTTCHLLAEAETARNRRTVDQLEHALHSRVAIEQAKGIVAARRHLSVEEAYAVLRRYANDHNETLRAVADAVVRRGLRP